MQATRQLVTPNLFPSANVVYVDNDFGKLRSKGLLAYGTLQDAIISWRAGGAARARYGTPSATNTGNILLGAGTLEVGSGVLTDLDIDVDFINIVGLGKEISILTSAFTQSWIFRVIQSNVNLYNFTIKSTSSISFPLRFQITNYTGRMFGVRITGDASAGLVAVTNTNMNGIFDSCEFDGASITSAVIVLDLSGPGETTGRILDCQFFGSSSVINLLRFNVNDCTGLVSNCFFRGDVSASHINNVSTNNVVEINDCRFESSATAKAFISTSSADANQVQFNDCTFATANTCIDMISGLRSRFLCCYFRNSASNGNVINLQTGSTGLIVNNSRLIGRGTGICVNSVDTISIEITHSTLRKPTGDVNGSSTSSNLTNLISTPFNAELPAATLF